MIAANPIESPIKINQHISLIVKKKYLIESYLH